MNFSRSLFGVEPAFPGPHRRRSGLHQSAVALCLVAVGLTTVGCSDDSTSSNDDKTTTSTVIDTDAIAEALGIPADAPEPAAAVADCISAATVLASMSTTMTTAGSIPAPADLDAQIETVRATLGADLQPSFDKLVEAYGASAGATPERLIEMVSTPDYIAANDQVTQYLQETCG